MFLLVFEHCFFLIKFKFFLHNRTHFLFPASQSESTSNISICLSSVSSTVESSQVGVDVARKTSESHDDAGEGWFYRIRLPTKLIPAWCSIIATTAGTDGVNDDWKSEEGGDNWYFLRSVISVDGLVSRVVEGLNFPCCRCWIFFVNLA